MKHQQIQEFLEVPRSEKISYLGRKYPNQLEYSNKYYLFTEDHRTNYSNAIFRLRATRTMRWQGKFSSWKIAS